MIFTASHSIHNGSPQKPLDTPLTIEAAREDRAATSRALLPGPVPVSERRNSLNL